MKIKAILLIFIMLMIINYNMYPQSMMIMDVQVSGNSRIDQSLILSTCGLKIGDALNNESIANAIKTLYQLEVFYDVDVSLSELSGGVLVNINVVELPVVTRVNYEGNKHLSNSRIEEIGVIRVGTYWSGIVQAENTRRLLAEYRSKGYNLADIGYRVRDTSDGFVIRVVINEGKKIVVRKINIFGNSELETKKILSKMKTKPRGLFRSGSFDRDKYQEDLSEIVKYYQGQGFIDARIIKFDETIQEDRFLTLNIYIDEGMQYFFGSINVVGNSHFEKNAILSRFSMVENEVFNMENFNKQLGSVHSMYYEEGYIYFRSDPQLHRNGNIVNITVSITENTRAKIHKIHITGNTKTKEKVIRRQLAVAPGDFFRQSRVIRSQQNVYNMGFFEPDMGLDYQAINNEGDVDLYLSVTDRQAGNINGGAGYNSRDGFILQLGLAHNNLFGNYWQTNLKYELSQNSQNFEFDFTNPHLIDTDILFGFNIYHTQRNWHEFGYSLFQNGGGIRLGYPIKALDYSKVIGGYSLLSKKYEVNNENRASAVVKNFASRGWQETSSINLTLSRDSRDNVFFPTTGSRITIYNELAGGFFGGDFDYFKQIAEVSWFTPIVWNTVLRTKWRAGYIEKYGSREYDVPPDERFYLGGTGPDGIRGYSDRSVAPYEGGKRTALFSSELGIPITSDQFYGLLFMDSGNAYQKFSDIDFKKFKTGAGLGIRLRTPFGLLGFDFSHNFEDHEWSPHFQFGTTF